MCVHKKINVIGRAMLMITAGLMAAGLIVSQLHAQSFTISQHAKAVGSASLVLKRTAAEVDATSSGKIDMPGLKYNFQNVQTLNGGFQLRSAKLTGSVNGKTATVEASPQGQKFLVKVNANGNTTNTPVDFHPQAVFYPDFDPAALQVLLNLGMTHNNRDIWALIPKQTGSIDALRIATKADEQGTLNGKTMPVHHLTVTSGTETTEIFSTVSNELVQAEWPDEGFALVRQGFVITPPAKPRVAPPPAQDPNAAPNTSQPTPQQH